MCVCVYPLQYRCAHSCSIILQIISVATLSALCVITPFPLLTFLLLCLSYSQILSPDLPIFIFSAQCSHTDTLVFQGAKFSTGNWKRDTSLFTLVCPFVKKAPS